MRSGKLRLVGVALAAAVFGATGCDRSTGRGDQARTETGTQTDSGTADPGLRRDTAATVPPVNARPDSTPAPPNVDTSSSRPRPQAQPSRRDTATSATKPQPATTAARDTAAPARRDTASRTPAGVAAGDTGTDTGKGTTGGGTPSKVVTPVEYTGWKQYEVNCARCHGEYGLGSTIAPSLVNSFKTGAVDSAEYQKVVHGSRIAKGMPNWTNMLSEEYLHAIYKYLSGRGAGRIPAGRPTPEG